MVMKLVLYRGDGVNYLDEVTSTTDPALIRHFASRMLDKSPHRADPALRGIVVARMRALVAILNERVKR